MVVARATSGRSLMHRHHVGKRAIEEPVVLFKQTLERSRERFVIAGVEVDQSAVMSEWREVDFIRPPRKGWNERDPALVAQHGALAALLSFKDVAVKAAPGLAHVCCHGVQLAPDHRRHEWVRVDLA